MASEESKNKPSKHSSGELLGSAKLVAEAAQSTLGSKSDKVVDKTKVADAAGDLLDAAGQYGKLDDQKGIGQYVDKTADYLHNYQATNTSAPPAQPDSKSEEAATGAGAGAGAGGLGGLGKLAGGFFNK